MRAFAVRSFGEAPAIHDLPTPAADGAYAEYTAVAPGVKTEPLARIPDGVTDEQAAALPVAGITALRSLELLGVTADERLVVIGATGGVGGYAVQMARARGAHVVATVRGDGSNAIRRDAEILNSGGSLVSTLYAADVGWFAGRRITAHNIASSANPLSSPQGLNEVARMLADGTITARICSTVELDGAGQMLEKLRHGPSRAHDAALP